MASFAAIVLAPVAVPLIGNLFGRGTAIAPTRIATIVLVSIVAPLALGIVIRICLPTVATRIARPVSIAGTVLLVMALLPVLFTATSAIWALIGDGVVIVLAAFTLIGLVVGHLLGGPGEEDRTVLALATSTRHPGVAIAIASLNFPDEKATLAVVLYHLVIGAILSVPYIKWRRQTAFAGADR